MEDLRSRIETLENILRRLREIGSGDVQRLAHEAERVVTEMRSLIDQFVEVTIMIDTVPTEHAVVEIRRSRRDGAELWVPKDVEVYRELAKVKVSWSAARNKHVLLELLPGVYIVDDSSVDELKRLWSEIVEAAIDRASKRVEDAKLRARLEFRKLILTRQQLREAIDSEIQRLRERVESIRVRLDRVAPSTRYTYLWNIAQLENKIQRLEELKKRL